MSIKIESPVAGIDLWLVPQDGSDDLLAQSRDHLSKDELARADRFRMPELTRRFILRHGSLRTIVSGYLNTAPGEIVFAVGPHGKPLVNGFSDSFHFNLSFSDKLAIVAVSRRFEVGVDIERLRVIEQLSLMANRYLTDQERQWLASLPEHHLDQGFLRLWTAKEALLKGLGTGMSVAPDRLSVRLGQPGEAEVVSICGEPASEWNLALFEPEFRYMAALAWRDGA